MSESGILCKLHTSKIAGLVHTFKATINAPQRIIMSTSVIGFSNVEGPKLVVCEHSMTGMHGNRQKIALVIIVVLQLTMQQRCGIDAHVAGQLEDLCCKLAASHVWRQQSQ